MPCRALLAVPVALLCFAAPARADQVTIGSDLAPDATIELHDGNDWAAWNTTLASGGLVQSPVQGEVNLVRIKGRIVPEGTGSMPKVGMRVMVLRPQGDGTVAPVTDAVSEELTPLPFGGDPNRISTYDRSAIDLPDGADGKGGTRVCIKKGDYLSFTANGGFTPPDYPNGARFEVFGVSRSISDAFFMGRAAAFDATPIRGVSQGGRELLMNAVIGTGRDARWTCRTDEEKKQNLDAPASATPTPSGGGSATTPGTTPSNGTAPAVATTRAAIPKPKKAPKVRGKKVKIVVTCPGPNACGGTLALRSYSTAKAFTLTAGQRVKVVLTLTKSARRKLRKKGDGLTVKALVTNVDGSHASRRFVIRRA